MQGLEWKKRKREPAPTELSSKFGPLLGQFLWARGYESEEQAEGFLNPRLDNLKSPFELSSLATSAERIATAIADGETIAVYADYDMDGMSGLALLVSFFGACGAKTVVPYQPSRLEEGYGVHPEAIRQLAEQGARVIVTVDTGITAREAANTAKETGVDLIITDHHQQLGDLPDTTYIINPNRELDQSGLRYLSGVGVAFYLAIGVRAKLRERGYFERLKMPEPELKNWLDLFVLGTIGDCVDLINDNRILVRVGLKQLLRTERPGLRLLLDRAIPNARQLSCRDVSFSLAPKLNAASRLGQAQLSTELLLTQDTVRATDLVNQLMNLNEQRGQIQKEVYEEALSQATAQVESQDPPVIVVHGEWHEGVLGVVAAKLVEKFSRPSVVLTRVGNVGMLRGSMRTLAPLSCVRALDTCRDLLHRYGGHKMAAGLQLKHDFFQNFSERLWNSTTTFISTLTEKENVAYDGSLPKHLDFSSVEALDAAAPWGTGNPEPLFKVKNLDLQAIQLLNGQHLKIQDKNTGLTVIGFFKSDDVERLKKSGAMHFDALVTPEINRFRNQKTLQLRLHYVRPSQASHPAP
jgi:single-stranded-DNA-specific exonuclease